MTLRTDANPSPILQELLALGMVRQANDGSGSLIAPDGAALGSFVGAVEADKPSGTYDEPITVALSCPTGDAILYYTTDGTDPTAGSSVYAAPIAVNASLTLKAVAAKFGSLPSGVQSWDYVVPAAAWSSTDKAESIVLSNGNLTAEQVGAPPYTPATVRSNRKNNAGCVYVEIAIDVGESSGTANDDYGMLALVLGSLDLNVIPGYSDAVSMGVWDDGYTVQNSDDHTGLLPGRPRFLWNQGDTSRWFIDFDAGKVWVGNNVGWSGDPEAGTGERFTFPPNTDLFFAFNLSFSPASSVVVVTANFGAGVFVFPVPRAGTTKAWDGSAL